jgi:methyltransferase family protein
MSDSVPGKGTPLLERIIEDNPRFHFYRGSFTSWAPHPDTLRFLYGLLTPGMATLETGCGQTTVVFAIAGVKHVSVTPSADEAERVQRYCSRLGIAGDITFIIESSDVALPRENGAVPEHLDHVFIDGAHAFPASIIDYHYTARRLKIGGILGVDDFKMPSVHVLFQFLRTEAEWELVRLLSNTAFFRKLSEPKVLVDWSGQKINAGFRGY